MKNKSLFDKLEKQYQARLYYEKNQERKREISRTWYANNKEHHLSSVSLRTRMKDKAAIFGHKCCAYVYELRDSLTNQTGISHHVDHIIPLKHKDVCGLHVPNNLRAVPADLNMAKGNSWVSDWN